MNSVLCVDDDPTALSIQAILLKNSKFCSTVFMKAHGKEALEFYDELVSKNDPSLGHPSIIFLDLNMPVMDGWAFLESFQSDYFSKFPDTVVYILSSSVDPDDMKRAKTFPFVKGFISKPITKEFLLKIKSEG